MPGAPTMTSDSVLQSVNYSASRRPSMGALGGYAGGGGAGGTMRAAPAGRPAGGAGGFGARYGGVQGGYNPFSSNGPITGRQYNRTDRTALPQGPFMEESYGVDPYGREYVASSRLNEGYVDPNLRYQLEHQRTQSEGEARDRLAEIREQGNQQRLTSGQEQGWTTGERGRARTWQVEDDARMFERLPGLWGMFTGEGQTPQTAGPDRPSMAALTSSGGAAPASLAASGGGVAGQSGAHGGINPGGGVSTGGLDTQAVQPKGAAADLSPAEQASELAFARAKDKAGLLAGARLKGARSALANSSLGTQARGVNAILGDAASGLSDVATAQAISQAQRAADVEDRNYAGGLTRRGQNMGLAPSILALLRSSGRAY